MTVQQTRFVVNWSGESTQRREEGKVGRSCLAMTRPDAGVFICIDKTVGDKYSTHSK